MQGLYAPLPLAVETGGACYAVNTDWRVALRIFAVLEDESLTAFEQQAVMLRLFYKSKVPPDANEAVRLAVKFLSCGEEPDADGAEAAPRLYSFGVDAPLIYAAMRRTYGQDVLDGRLHWYRFTALFADIADDTFFARLMHLRRGRLTGTLSAEERRVALALGRYMEMPVPRTVQADAAASAFFDAYRAGDAAGGVLEGVAADAAERAPGAAVHGQMPLMAGGAIDGAQDGALCGEVAAKQQMSSVEKNVLGGTPIIH